MEVCSQFSLDGFGAFDRAAICSQEAVRRTRTVKAQFSMRGSSIFAFCKGLGLLILLFLAVYVPVFAVAGALRHSPELLVPVVIVLSLGTAICLIAFFIRSRGMSSPNSGYACAHQCKLWSHLSLAYRLP